MNHNPINNSGATEMITMRHKTLLILLCLTVGLGIGAALTLLFSSSISKQTRKALTRSMGNGREAMEGTVGEAA
jgi:gas vesicle protein